jgi:hypothetical protein
MRAHDPCPRRQGSPQGCHRRQHARRGGAGQPGALAHEPDPAGAVPARGRRGRRQARWCGEPLAGSARGRRAPGGVAHWPADARSRRRAPMGRGCARRPAPCARRRRGSAALGAVGGLWEPLEAREALGETQVEPVRSIGVAVVGDGPFDARMAAWVEATEAGLRLARDLCGTEPERMAPPRSRRYVQQAFRAAVKVTVQKDAKKLQKEYPLLMAVARASLGVAPPPVRGAPRVHAEGQDRAHAAARRQGPHLRHRRRRPEDRRPHGRHEPRQGRRGGGGRPGLAAAKLGARRAPGRRARRGAQQHRQRRLRQRRDHHQPRRLPRAHRQHRRRGPPGAGRPAVAPAPRRRQGREPAPVLGGDADRPRRPRHGPLQHRARQRPGAFAGTRRVADASRRCAGRPVRGLAPAPRGLRLRAAAQQGRRRAVVQQRAELGDRARPPVPDGVPVPRQRPRQTRQRQRPAAALHARRHRRQRLPKAATGSTGGPPGDRWWRCWPPCAARPRRDLRRRRLLLPAGRARAPGGAT